MKIELGAKKDIYTGARCMGVGILLGRVTAGLSRFSRALTDETEKSPAYTISGAIRPAYDAAKQLQDLLPKARPQVKSLLATLEGYKESGYGFNKAAASNSLVEAEKQLSTVAQMALKDCGKRRPEEGEGEALLRMKRVKREKAPARTQELMKLPDLPSETIGKACTDCGSPVQGRKETLCYSCWSSNVGPKKSSESGTTLGLVASVLGLIGITFLVGRM
jgi:hypothetical protein